MKKQKENLHDKNTVRLPRQYLPLPDGGICYERPRGKSRDLYRLTKGDPQKKVSLLLEWAGEKRSVADPWYTDDYETAYRDIREGCAAILKGVMS